jgi:xanthine dehydrogenase YagS FAD-binding subunit
MNRFSYVRARDVDEAVRAVAADRTARVIAGGTNLVDLMKYQVERPTRLVDITRIAPLRMIEDVEGGGLRIGALVSNTAVAYDRGNLLQRTRCYYFYDPATPCNKREPGTGCPAILGLNRIHAILGHSEHCIATHPSDMCVALTALEATVQVTGPGGPRTIPMAEFHRLPGDRPEIDTTLRRDEIVTAVELPVASRRFRTHCTYLKLRDRLSYAFALVSVAVGLEMDGNRIGRARIALGGVAHKPWRRGDAEELLTGKPADADAFEAAAGLLLEGAKGFEHNAFKIGLARRAIVRALGQAAAGTPQSQTDKRIR